MGSLTATLSTIDIKVMKRGPVLSRQERLNLCVDISEEEIYAGLQAIDNAKAPGIDSYNSLFYKHTWQIIKHGIIEVV